MHYITYENLYKVVLEDIRKHSKAANIDSEILLNKLSKINDLKSKKEICQSEKDIIKVEKRIEEINFIIKRLYEDNVLGKIDDDRFLILTQDYEKELKQLTNTSISLRKNISTFTEGKVSFSKFTNIIQKYTNITELDEIILNELIEKIIIHECEYIDGKRVQKIDIYYRFVGII